MLLAYIDESGTNYKKINDYFKDGPYAMWSCILVNEKKYFDIERMFQDLAKKILPVGLNIKELHASEIWENRNKNNDYDKKIRRYFEELAQLTGKLHIPILIGIQQKNPNLNKNCYKKKKIELEKARYSLITLMEHKLADLNETAVLVSDQESTNEEMKNLVLQRTKWRYSPTTKRMTGVRPKFLFEYRSNFILDQLHYVDSKDSLLMQFSDNICFIIRKSLEQLYLLNFPDPKNQRPIADKKHVPITSNTFNSLANFTKILVSSYNDEIKDVNLNELCDISSAYYQFEKSSNHFYTTGIQQSPETAILKSFTPYK